MTLKEKVIQANIHKQKYMHMLEIGDNKEANKEELLYLEARREAILAVDENINKQSSITMAEVKKRVASMGEIKRRETGIESLDYELVSFDKVGKRIKGGFSLGNFIQIAGTKGSGKSSFMMRILTSLSKFEKVCWFDFEMGERRVVKKLESFIHDDQNLLYYSGSRTLEDVIDEIKFLNSDGANHFVIDSTMKLTVKGADRYDKFSTISGELSALTSQLNINIYLINQISQSSDRDNNLSIKHGNDAEYDADFIFYLLKKPADEVDELDMIIYDESVRILKCEKNRQDERLFSITIPKGEIVMDVEVTNYEG